MPRQDDLLAIAEAHAAHRTLHRMRENAADATESYRQALQSGDIDGASMELERLAEIAARDQLISKYVGADRGALEQPQPQQHPNQLTEAEQLWLRNNPSVAGDQRKFAEVVGAANALIARGYDRNSPQYLTALNIAMGNTDNSAQSELTPDEVVRICKSKYGATTPDEYNVGVDALREGKAFGLIK
jgi:hypothetical protein